jgi:hypothetical protein
VLTSLVLLQAATALPAPPDEPPDLGAEEAHVDPKWFVRLGFGMGTINDSETKRALSLEGYGGERIWFPVDGAMLVHPNFGIGMFGAYGTRSSSATNGSPELHESTWVVGAQLPIVVRTDALWFVIAPRLGRATKTLSFHDAGSSVSGLAYGGEMSLVLPRIHLGFGLGFLRAPTSSPGAVGLGYDAGGVFFSISGVLHG